MTGIAVNHTAAGCIQNVLQPSINSVNCFSSVMDGSGGRPVDTQQRNCNGWTSQLLRLVAVRTLINDIATIAETFVGLTTIRRHFPVIQTGRLHSFNTNSHSGLMTMTTTKHHSTRSARWMSTCLVHVGCRQSYGCTDSMEYSQPSIWMGSTWMMLGRSR